MLKGIVTRLVVAVNAGANVGRDVRLWATSVGLFVLLKDSKWIVIKLL